MITRADYMTGKATHDAYYGQFLFEGVLILILNRIGAERIHASKDHHFNDIPLGEWDMLHDSIQRMCGKHVQETGDVNSNSLGVSVCIAKAAARYIKAKGIAKGGVT